MTTTATQDLRKLADPGLLVPHLQARTQRGADTNKNQNWGAVVVPYIDARGAAAILDESLGVAGWGFAFHTPPTKRQGGQGFGAVGRLTLYIDLPNGSVREVVHEDIGAGGDDSMETGAKGAASDSLKRCAAQAGVGRLLGRLGEVKVPASKCYTGGNGKMAAKDAAVDEVLKGLRATLTTWAAAWAERGAAEATPPAPAAGDAHDYEPEPEAPAPAEPTPEPQATAPAPAPEAPASPAPAPAPVPSDEAAADAAYAAAQAATSAINETVAPTSIPSNPPTAPPAPSASPLDAAIRHLGAPLEGDSWQTKANWVREQLGGEPALKQAQTALSVRYLSAMAKPETYAAFLNYVLERKPVNPEQEAA